MSSIVAWLDRRAYPNFEHNWDDQIFRDRVLAKLTRDSVVLDLGAGAGIVPQMNFRGAAARVCGIDLDVRVMDNPNVDEARVADAGSIPYEDGLFDIVFADNVMEHLETPEQVFLEIHRVLKPGGILLLKTPNRTHYMPMISRMTPHHFHQYINKIRGRAAVDTFPAFYRANDAGQIRRLAANSGFTISSLELIEGRPEYLRMTAATYLAGLIYERIVNASDLLARFRIVLIAELRKAHANSGA